MISYNLETCRQILLKAREKGYLIVSPYDGYNVSPLSLFLLYSFSTRTISDMTEGKLREPEIRKMLYTILEQIVYHHPEVQE